MNRATVRRALATALLALFFAAAIALAVLSIIDAPGGGGPHLCEALVHVESIDVDSSSALVTVIDPEADDGLSSTFDTGDSGEVTFDHMLGRGSSGLPERRSDINLRWIGEAGIDDEFPLSAYDWKPAATQGNQ